MGISVARKLQAFRVLMHKAFEFELHRVTLLPEQVRVFGLPSTPLKDTERRASKWTRATGLEQADIDAMIALRRSELAGIARAALDQFYNHELDDRAARAYMEWKRRVQQVIDEGMDGDRDDLIGAAQEKLDQAAQLVREAREPLETNAEDADLPKYEPPVPEVTGATGMPLVSSGREFPEQCRELIESKRYGGNNGED
jgi:hypothetical protein